MKLIPLIPMFKFCVKYIAYLLLFSGVFAAGFIFFSIILYSFYGILYPFEDFGYALYVAISNLQTSGFFVLVFELGFIFALVGIYFFTKNDIIKFKATMKWWVLIHLLFLPIGFFIPIIHTSYKWQLPIYFPTLGLVWLSAMGVHKALRR